MNYTDKKIHGGFAETSFGIVLSGKTSTDHWWLDENGNNWWNGTYVHDFDIIYYILCGQLQLKIEGSWCTVSAGQLVYIPAGAQMECKITGTAPVEKYYFHFNASLRHLPILTGYTRANIVTVGNSPELQTHFETVCNRSDSTCSGVIQAHSAGLAIIHEFLQRADIKSVPHTIHTQDNIGNAMQYITAHFAEALTVASLAARAGLSRDHFSRKFISRYGCSPIQYITRIRIHEAEVLLTSTDRSIAEIAESVGLSDSSYFSRLFKKSTGMYPQHFRMLSRSAEKQQSVSPKTDN